MSNAFTRNVGQPVAQTKRARADQVKNNAGGYVFAVGDKQRLERFLILGIDGGTYYVTEKDLLKQNIDWLIELIGRNEELVWDTIFEVSTAGRAYRNSPAIFATALLFEHGKIKDEPQVRKEKTATNLLQAVCRTTTHLAEWAKYMKLLGAARGVSGWNTAKGKAIARWYEAKPAGQLAYQAVKYRQREGFTHQDLFRLGHPKQMDQQVANFILDKQPENEPFTEPVLFGFQNAQRAKTKAELLAVLEQNPELPWEALPTQFLKEAEVWKKLFYNKQLRGQALLRNIVRLAKLDAFKDMEFTSHVANRLTDPFLIESSRLHPIQYLLALVNYTEGQIPRRQGGSQMWYYAERQKDWVANPVITDALNAGFYLAFKAVVPANKKTLIGLDVSGSMAGMALGIDLSCAQVGAAMSMSVARTEPYYQIMGFTSNFKDLGITPNMGLSEVMKRVQQANFGSTDCALPMKWAKNNKVDVDTFVVMTDNETWAGRGHPYQALQQYRQFIGHDAKLVVAGMASTGFTIADPSDRGMLDIVGADADLPRLVSEFSAGRV